MCVAFKRTSTLSDDMLQPCSIKDWRLRNQTNVRPRCPNERRAFVDIRHSVTHNPTPPPQHQAKPVGAHILCPMPNLLINNVSHTSVLSFHHPLAVAVPIFSLRINQQRIVVTSGWLRVPQRIRLIHADWRTRWSISTPRSLLIDSVTN